MKNSQVGQFEAINEWFSASCSQKQHWKHVKLWFLFPAKRFNSPSKDDLTNIQNLLNNKKNNKTAHFRVKTLISWLSFEVNEKDDERNPNQIVKLDLFSILFFVLSLHAM